MRSGRTDWQHEEAKALFALHFSYLPAFIVFVFQFFVLAATLLLLPTIKNKYAYKNLKTNKKLLLSIMVVKGEEIKSYRDQQHSFSSYNHPPPPPLLLLLVAKKYENNSLQ